MILDANAHVGPGRTDDLAFEPTLDVLSRHLAAADIDGAVVSPRRPPGGDLSAANEWLATEVEDEQYYPVARIDPLDDDAVEQARRALDAGMRGLRLHPWEDGYRITDPSVATVIEAAADRTVPVWIHAGYPVVTHALSVRPVVDAFPDVRFVLTHAAQLDPSGGGVADALLLARTTRNTYFELSGVYRRDLIENLLATVGPERVLFGSNAPYFHPAVEKTRITAADIPAEAKARMLGPSVQALL